MAFLQNAAGAFSLPPYIGKKKEKQNVLTEAHKRWKEEEIIIQVH